MAIDALTNAGSVHQDQANSEDDRDEDEDDEDFQVGEYFEDRAGPSTSQPFFDPTMVQPISQITQIDQASLVQPPESQEPRYFTRHYRRSNR